MFEVCVDRGKDEDIQHTLRPCFCLRGNPFKQVYIERGGRGSPGVHSDLSLANVIQPAMHMQELEDE